MDYKRSYVWRSVYLNIMKPLEKIQNTFLLVTTIYIKTHRSMRERNWCIEIFYNGSTYLKIQLKLQLYSCRIYMYSTYVFKERIQVVITFFFDNWHSFKGRKEKWKGETEQCSIHSMRIFCEVKNFISLYLVKLGIYSMQPLV